MNSVLALFAVALAFQNTVLESAISQKDQIVGQDRWEVNYDNDNCTLIRHFSEAGKLYRLAMERSWTSDGYGWSFYGSALPVHSSMKSVEIVLGRSDVRRFNFRSDAIVKGEVRLTWSDPNGRLFNDMREGDSLQIMAGANLDVSLNLPNLTAATQALEKCEDDMWAQWGFNPQQVRSLSKRAEPSSDAGRWVIDADYPRADFLAGNRGIATYLLNVDPEGAVTSCRIVDSTGFPGLDKQTCALMVIRATFHPALGSDGRPVASYYINRVFWNLPR